MSSTSTLATGLDPELWQNLVASDHFIANLLKVKASQVECSVQPTITSQGIDIPPKPIEPIEPHIYELYSEVVDPLFWLLFIGYNGVDEFNRVHYNCGKLMVTEKQKVVDIVSSIPHKQFQTITGSGTMYTKIRIKELMSMVQTSKYTTMDMMHLFAVFYKTPIFIVDETLNTFCVYDYKGDVDTNDNPPIILYIHFTIKNLPCFTVDTNAIDTIRSGKFDTDYIQIQSYNTPLDSISKYNKGELVKIYNHIACRHKHSNQTPEPPHTFGKKDPTSLIKAQLYDEIMGILSKHG